MVAATLYVRNSFEQGTQLIEVLRKMASEPVDEKVVKIAMDVPDKYKPYVKGQYWFHPLGAYSLILPDSFFKPSNRRFFNKAFKAYDTFIKPLRQVQIKVSEEMKKGHDPEKDGIRPLTYFSVIADVNKKLTFAFLVTEPVSEENFQMQLNGAKVLLQDYLKSPKKYSTRINRLHKVDKKTIFLLCNDGSKTWEFANVLFLVGREKMLRYKKNLDKRFAKPLMIVNETNVNREFTFTTNWSIQGRTRRYTMNRTNDIGMYQSIANKALKRAKDKFTEIHTKNVTELIMPEAQVSEFFDYFEEIIQAVISSYTTIECMANSCIPSYHKHTVGEKGITKIYDKQSIERGLSLRDKLKSVIPGIIDSSSPAAEKWWQEFIKLEDLRNEIIHSKESKAEIRYSALIDDRIFKTVSVHDEIVSYYATLLCKAESALMNDFPIGVGCDEVMPALMKDKDFKKEYKELFNVSL